MFATTDPVFDPHSLDPFTYTMHGAMKPTKEQLEFYRVCVAHMVATPNGRSLLSTHLQQESMHTLFANLCPWMVFGRVRTLDLKSLDGRT